MKITDTSIVVNDIEIFARHGVYEHERLNGNNFRVSLRLDFDARAAMEFDDLDTTVNYAQAVDIVKQVMDEPSQLIEHVTRRIIAALAEAFPIVQSGTVSVTKLNPPVDATTGGATFTASFHR